MKSFKTWIKKICLFPMFVLMGIPDGDPPAGGDNTPPGDNTILGGDPAGNNAPSDDLSGIFTPEEITAKREALTAAQAEETRRAALTDEERATEDAAKAEAAKKGEVPEEYAEFKLPDGFEVDKELLAEFLPIAKELKLTQEQAQKLVDIQAKIVGTRFESWGRTLQQWQNDAKTDKEIGGDNFTKNVEIAQRSINTFGTPELKAVLNQYGLGNHPEVIRWALRVGNAMREDSIVLPGNQSSSEYDLASKLYGKSNMK